MQHGGDMKIARYVCPECSADDQRIPWYLLVNRVAKMRCSSCGSELQSEIGFIRHLCFSAYVHALGLIAGVMVVVGFLTHSTSLIVGPIIVLMLITLPISVWLHTRYAKVSRQDSAIRSSVRRYCRTWQIKGDNSVNGESTRKLGTARKNEA